MRKLILIMGLIPLLAASQTKEKMSIEKIRISQLPIAAASEVNDDMWMVFNTKQNITKRMQMREMRAAMPCTLYCHDVTIPAARVLSIGSAPFAAGIPVPAGYAIALQSGVMMLDFNSVAYATETDITIQADGSTTYLLNLSSVLGTFLDMNGAFFPTPVNPLEKRILTGADLMISTPTTTDPTMGDSDVKFKFYYHLIQL